MAVPQATGEHVSQNEDRPNHVDADEQPFRLEVATARAICELPDSPESNQLLGDLVRRGDRIVLGAGTGEGKTTIALQIVKAIVLGEEFLDWQGPGGRALIVDAEQSLRTIKRRLREAGLDQSDAVDYIRVPDGLALNDDEAQVAELERIPHGRQVRRGRRRSALQLHTGDSNAEREGVDLMRIFDRWREELRFAFVVPCHTRKPPPGAKFTINEIFGTGAYTRGAEGVLGLQRLSDGYSWLHFFKDRDGDPPIGSHWGLLFDREVFRRDPKDGEQKRTCKDQVHDLLYETPD